MGNGRVAERERGHQGERGDRPVGGRVEPPALGRHTTHFATVEMDQCGDLSRVERLALGGGPLHEWPPASRDAKRLLHFSDSAIRSAAIGAAERLSATCP